MIRKKLLVIMIMLVLFTLFVILFISTDKQAVACKDIKSIDEKYYCYHSLAHKMNNRSICAYIEDSELREHCLIHVPG